MSDLISRSEVNDVIDGLEVYTSGRPNTMKVEVSVLQLQRFINKLKNIPTAYDVDKVVEQLKLTSKTALDLAIKRIPGFRFMAPGFQALIDECFEEAVEIVKAGGDIELSEHSESQGNRTGK